MAAETADPRGAAYFQQLAALQHQYDTSLAGNAEGLTNARSNAVYGEGQLTQQEPRSYQQNERTANKGGILESGVNAERRGTIAQQYAAKRAQVQKGLLGTEGQLRRSNELAGSRLQSGQANALGDSVSEGYKRLLEESPMSTPGAGPAAPKAAGPVKGPPITVVGGQAQPVSGVRRKAATNYLANAKRKARF